MRALLKKYLILASVVHLVRTLIISFKIDGNWQSYLTTVFLLFILRTFISPIINLLILPLNLITLNLTNWLLQVLMVFIWVLISPQVTISSWDVGSVNFGPVNMAPLHLPWLPVFIISSLAIILSYRVIYWLFK